MPELPEVEILVRHLAPLVKNQKIRGLQVGRARVIAPTTETELERALKGSTFTNLTRRGKYLLFKLTNSRREPFTILGHLGMTGRIYLLPKKSLLPKHAAVVLDLGARNFIYEDTRYFGRFTLDTTGLASLGPEPLGPDFTPDYLASALKRSNQSIKVKLLDQTLVAGVGNIYASEALFRARISPRTPTNKLTASQLKRLRDAIRDVLENAIKLGIQLALDFSGEGERNGLFYYGQTPDSVDAPEERFKVYDRAGKQCPTCGTPIKRIVQAARSTFYCPHCQRD